MTKIQIEAHSESDTKHIAARLGRALQLIGLGGLTFYLHGDLGAGKTTFTRHLVQGLGHIGSVKSPTYTLVEPYDIGDIKLFHFDLYRLADPEELEFMGIRDYFNETSLCVIEWPEKGWGLLAEADVECTILIDGDNRQFELMANTRKGEQLLTTFSEN